jgi:broad specificity phosphatase PhoE
MARAVIFLVRHGETEWNRVRRYQGWGDSPLTARGVAQAEAIGRRLCTLREAEAAEIVASPIGRARRTAEIIRGQITADGLGRTASLRFDERLREISIGAWDGLDRDEIAALAPRIFDGDGRHEWYFRTPDGETYDDSPPGSPPGSPSRTERQSSPLPTASLRGSCAASMPGCHARPR